MEPPYKQCPVCEQTVSGQAEFCPDCGHPFPSLEEVSATNLTLLICPHCFRRDSYLTGSTQPLHSLTCPVCHKGFASRIVTIRSKSSTVSQIKNCRSFFVRVHEADGPEHEIAFRNAGYEDIDLPPRAMAAFTYIGETLRVVQNLTTGRYMKISAPACYLATCVYGPHSEEVRHLRQFRDERLLHLPLTAAAVRLYYRLSSRAVARFGSGRLFRTLCRALLYPMSALLARRECKKPEL